MSLTSQQVKWAKQHDWFVKTVRCQVVEQYEFVIGVEVLEQGTQLLENGTSKEYSELKHFTDFKELRNWAGY